MKPLETCDLLNLIVKVLSNNSYKQQDFCACVPAKKQQHKY